MKIMYKKGGVSLYIVVFMTLMFGVITLGFIRIVLNDAKQTSNTDLYNSAYDSAMAGIEDAKVALIKYHDCLSQGATPDGNAHAGSCPRIVYEMQKGVAEDSCDVVQRVLNRDVDNQQGVVVQETQNANDNASTSYMEQSYTCVKITEETENYLTTFSAKDNTRIVPIHSSDLKDIKAIQVSWYSGANAAENASNSSNGKSENYMTDDMKPNQENAWAPPIITFELFQTDTVASGNYCSPNPYAAVPVTSDSPCFSMGELYAYNQQTPGTDHSMLVLYPVASSASGPVNNFINANTVLANADKHYNDTIDVNCNNKGDYYCTATIEIPKTFRGTDRAVATSFVKMTLPYDRPNTDISLYFCDGINEGSCTSSKTLTGVQAAIDSTGRANDLYRRVEVRVELIDLYYPYPEYALHLSGDSSTDKNFFVTKNCQKADNGKHSTCANSGTL